MKGNCYIFSDHKQRNKVCLVYLEGKLQEHSIAIADAFST